ncbi:uncharacterized protein LOC143581854 [Bidens hawaiensis]|uniref:uncharacterized protein LOC143581854 n=1 Tax=Bidens hawaiensis TaxID=980011 RepID=UPI00404B9AA4
MVKEANKKRLDKEISVGDFVYLRLQKYHQTSVAALANQKLSRRFFGPYRILQRIGNVAYKLDLPTGSRIHPVFHVSLLKQAHGQITPSNSCIDDVQEEEIGYLPESVLDQRQNHQGVHQLLIKWEKRPLEDATWEAIEELQQQFPGFLPIEDNGQSQGGGDDTPQATTDDPGPTAPVRPTRIAKIPARLLE